MTKSPQAKGEKRLKTLERVFSKAGMGSRTDARSWIGSGRVRVNSIVIENPDHWVDLDRDHVTLDNEPLVAREKTYILLYKPTGYLTTYRDPENRPTVYDLLTDFGEWLSPIGRLDLDSSGLLLLTNDTDLGERIANPEHKVSKTYQVKAATVLTDEQLDRLRNGVELSDGPTRPAAVTRLRENAKYTHIEITLTEGRNRQVRRMLEAVDSKVLKLVRTAIGPIRIDDLLIGKWRKLTDDEVVSLGGTKPAPQKEAEMPTRGGGFLSDGTPIMAAAPPPVSKSIRDRVPVRAKAPVREAPPKRDFAPRRDDGPPSRGGAPYRSGPPSRDSRPPRRDDGTPYRSGPPKRDDGPRRDGPPSRGGAPYRSGPPSRDARPPRRDDGPPSRGGAPYRSGPPSRDARPPRRDDGPPSRGGPPYRSGPPSRDARPPRRDDGPPSRGGAPYRSGPPKRDDGPRRDGPPSRGGAPYRSGPPKRDDGPRRDGPPSRGGAPYRSGPPKRDDGPRRDGPPSRGGAPYRSGPPKRDDGPRRDGPPSRGGAPYRSGPPKRDSGPSRGRSGPPAPRGRSPKGR